MDRWTIDRPQRLTFAEPVRRLDVRLVSGRLNVVGTDGPARLEVTALGSRPLVVSQIDGALRVEFEQWRTGWSQLLGPVWWFLAGRKRYTADISIAVPHQAYSTLRLVSGSLVASALYAGVDVEVTSGRVTLLGLAGRTSAKVISGPVEALGVGGELILETVSGELVVADSTAERVQAKAISGAITADLDNPPRHSEIHLETVSGEITARVREDSDLSVHLGATSGRITTTFAALREDATPGRKSVRGVLGSGAGRLRATAVSGNIALLRRPVDDEEPYRDTPEGGGVGPAGEAPANAAGGPARVGEASAGTAGGPARVDPAEGAGAGGGVR